MRVAVDAHAGLIRSLLMDTPLGASISRRATGGGKTRHVVSLGREVVAMF